jgi:hypothetical protein
MTNKLPAVMLPCPFCGHADIDPHEWLDDKGRSGPGCPKCDCMGGSVDAWQRRTGQSALDAMTAERDALRDQLILRDGTIEVLEAQRNTLMDRHKERCDERDAMTAERDALQRALEASRLDRVKWRKTLTDERDAARRELAEAVGLLRAVHGSHPQPELCSACALIIAKSKEPA